MHYWMNFVRIIKWIFLELSHEFCWNHRTLWILLKLSNECWLNCFWNGGENQMCIKENLSNFATSLSNVLNKLKYIWILLSTCGNYQMHIRNIEYWYNSATIHVICKDILNLLEDKTQFSWHDTALCYCTTTHMHCVPPVLFTDL